MIEINNLENKNKLRKDDPFNGLTRPFGNKLNMLIKNNTELPNKYRNKTFREAIDYANNVYDEDTFIKLYNINPKYVKAYMSSPSNIYKNDGFYFMPLILDENELIEYRRLLEEYNKPRLITIDELIEEMEGLSY